ncbi:MAG: isoprenoid biosynthesis glyoxalase ElbB [bacterium]|nr:isoprenoid biosynthesis glyoxalase ElbB [bacterium]MCP5041215.1 isoprenoid biosynthesis glyoxalase ElbB [bacterium]
MSKVGVVLSGCGVYDGSEIHESVITMLALSRAGAQCVMAAPDKDQMHVIDHRTGQPSEGETRNVLTESARIARGEIVPLAEMKADDIDALILPGGFGAAKNLSGYATEGQDMTVDEDLSALIGDMHAARKPIGFICISPVIGAKLLPGVKLTIGCDADTAADMNAMGAQHDDTTVDQIAVDDEHNVVSTAAYMLGPTISDVASGIEALVAEVVRRAK